MIEVKVGHSYLLRTGQTAVCFYKVRNQDRLLCVVLGSFKIYYTTRYMNNSGDSEIEIVEDLGVVK